MSLIVGKLFDVFNATKRKKPYHIQFKMQRNYEYRYVRLTVVRFSANGKIRKYYPRHADYEVVTPDADCVFEIAQHRTDPHSARETSTFKAFITTAPTSFDIAEGLRIRSGPMTGSRNNEFGANREVPEPPVPRELRGETWGIFRDLRVPEEANPPARWRTMSVTIHTTSG